MKSWLSILLAVVSLPVPAEEKMNALQTALSATTISGYLDTAIEWDNGAPLVHPQVPTNGLAPIPNWGSDTLNYFARTSFTNTSADLNARGLLDVSECQQGAMHRNQVRLTLRHLSPIGAAQLLAWRAGDTNLTGVADIEVTGRGGARVQFLAMIASQSGSTNATLWGFADVTDVAALAVADTNQVVVLGADLTRVDRLQYSVKRQLTSYYGAGGLLNIQGSTRRGLLRLQAMNLMPANEYLLALNGTVVTNLTSDARGRLRCQVRLTPAVTPFNLRSVELVGTNLVSVLWTELP